MSLTRRLMMAASGAAAPAFATIPYTDDFAIDTSDDWAYGGEAVNGTITVAAGSLIYTRGAGDGDRPRIVRGILVTPGETYTVAIPAPTGTATQKELWVSSDGGSYAAAITPVAVNAALNETFTAPIDGFGVVWIVMRAGTGSVTGETVAISSASMDVAAAPAMGAPVFLVLGASVDIDIETDTADTITSASVTPPANARITIAAYGRGSSSRTHDSVTAGFATVAGFTKIGDVAVENPGGTFHRLSMWDATTTATPGSGTVAAVASGTNFQRAMGGTAIANVGSRVIADDAVNTTGTTIALTLTGATTDDAAVVATVGLGDVSGTLTFADGLTHAGNSPVAQGVSFTVGMGYKVSPSATQTTSGLANNQAKLSVGALYRGAA